MQKNDSRRQGSSLTRDEALALSPQQAIALFGELPAPAADDVAGEFDGHIPDHIHDDWHALLRGSGLGNWLGKGYLVEPASGFAGHGYNCYLKDGSVQRHMRFAWSIGPSSLDGLPALVMRYAPFDNWSGRRDLVDELRVMGPGLLLGLYHTREPVEGFTPRPGGARSAMEFFVLQGPLRAASSAMRD